MATTNASQPAWTQTQHQNFVAIGYGGNPPEHVGIYAPGQTTASTTITYNGCCIFALAFNAQNDLVVLTHDEGILFFAAGASGPPYKRLPAQGGFSVAISPQGDYAAGGYNVGPTVSVYPGGSASARYTIPGGPAQNALAFSPSGELAVPKPDGSISTYPHGSTTPNRTLPLSLTINGASDAILAYDGAGNLAVGSPGQSTIGVYPPGATTPAYTLTGFHGPEALAFDSTNRLVVGDNGAIYVYATGSSTVVRTIPNVNPVALALGAQGDVAIASWAISGGQVYQSNGNVVTFTGLFQPTSIAISP